MVHQKLLCLGPLLLNLELFGKLLACILEYTINLCLVLLAKFIIAVLQVLSKVYQHLLIVAVQFNLVALQFTLQALYLLP